VRGSPLLRAIIAFFIIALAGIPLWKLTHRPATPVVVESSEPIKARPVQLELTLTHPANRVTIRHLGKPVWTSAAAVQDTAEATFTLPWPREGVDLRVQIDWPADAPLAAARLRLTDPEGTEHEQSVWSKGPSDDVLTFR
jgi:hypothetical protein